jgi:transcription elongation factor Elf1
MLSRAGGTMPTRIQPEEWKFEKAVICFNCNNSATQVLSIQNEQAIVVCTSCNASRHYVIRSVIQGTDTAPVIALGGRYEPWEFEKVSTCINCKEPVINKIYLDDYKISVVCEECGFTRIFKFNSLEIPVYTV